MTRLRALLNTHSYFSFGRGVSSPAALVERAAALGYTHVGLTDELGVYGAVELHRAARERGLGAVVGATVPLTHDGEVYPVVLLAASRRGYETLNRLISLANAGEGGVTLPVLEAHATDLHLLTGGRKGFPSRLIGRKRVKEAVYLLEALKNIFHERLWVQHFYDCYPWDLRRAKALRAFAKEHRVGVVAAPEVRYATSELMPLYDTLLCGRLGITLGTPHEDRPLNDCQAVPTPDLFPLPFPEAIENANRLAEMLVFELLPDRLTPPPARVPDGFHADSYLESVCRESLLERYSGPLFGEAKERLERELYTVKSLGFADFFLVVKEVMDFCRSRGILASGRGSAAGSVVCYLLGITQADPVEHGLLFERFLHTGRRVMPDIDIDISSSRRDEVFAWVGNRFPNSAMVCNKVTYYLPSALQDLGRALGLPPHVRNRLNERAWPRDYRHTRPHKAKEAEVVFDEVLGRRAGQGRAGGLAGEDGEGLCTACSTPLRRLGAVEVSTRGLFTLGALLGWPALLCSSIKTTPRALGLIKLDLLGLRMLGVFREDQRGGGKTRAHLARARQLARGRSGLEGRLARGDTLTLFSDREPGANRG